MDGLEKIKIYAQMLLEVINEEEKRKYEEKKDAAAEKERQMLIDLSGISINAKPRADGRYQGYYTRDGKKHYVYGKSEQEVKIKIELFLQNGEPKKKQSEKKKATPTVAEWLEKWIELYKTPNLKPTSMRQLRGALKPAFEQLGGKNLSSLDTEELQSFLLTIEGERTRDLCRGFLGQAFRKAFLRGLIKRNPCEALELKKHKSAHRKALTKSEQEKFLKEIEPIAARPLFVFLLQTGLRIGEALALTYGDIDYEQKTVTVNKNVVFIGGKRIDQNTPKSDAGVRIVPVPENALQLIRGNHSEKDLVFPYTYAGARSALRRVSKNLGFEVTAHLLRHTYATRLEEAGISPKLKQYLLGHASLEMTQNTYTDVQTEYLLQNAERIKAAFDTELTPETR